MTQVIRLFMWGYQPHFRYTLQYRMQSVLDALGVTDEPKAFLVGVHRPEGSAPHPVCIEPEKKEWDLALFDGLLPAVEQEIAGHALQPMMYGDSASMARKPERISRDAVRLAVQHAVAPHELKHTVRCFCGVATLVGDYYVVPVIQVPAKLMDEFPPVPLISVFARQDAPVDRSLLLAAIYEVLDEATEALGRPEPGRDLGAGQGPARNVARAAAIRFMSAVSGSIESDFTGTDLFESLNTISSLMYEGGHGHGTLILTSPSADGATPVLRFKQPVPLSEPRWARKVLELARGGAPLIADGNRIYGLGAFDADAPLPGHAFTVRILDHCQWELRHAGQSLIACRYGEPQVPQDVIRKDLFMASLRRFFPGQSDHSAARIWGLLLAAAQQRHGSMLVVASDAAAEAHRLGRQGTTVEATLLTEDLLKCVSGIDGTILIDPDGMCYAMGVILDGTASPECTASRGSRYNSAVRYIQATPRGQRRIAIVVSEDRTLDVLPELRPNLSRLLIEETIAILEGATLDDYHVTRAWIDENRFYLDVRQCERANAALDRIEQTPSELGQLVIITTRLTPHKDFEAIYLDP